MWKNVGRLLNSWSKWDNRIPIFALPKGLQKSSSLEASGRNKWYWIAQHLGNINLNYQCDPFCTSELGTNLISADSVCLKCCRSLIFALIPQLHSSGCALQAVQFMCCVNQLQPEIPLFIWMIPWQLGVSSGMLTGKRRSHLWKGFQLCDISGDDDVALIQWEISLTVPQKEDF